MTDSNTTSVSLLAMTQAVGAFTTFLPPLTAVRQGSINDPGFAADVRVGEIAAAGLTLGIGALIASLTGSPTPTIVAGVTAVGMIVLYEMTLRSGTHEVR